MRPVEIQVEGLTSFRELQKVRFDDLELFVITGPTGAGKTTLLDAMILALYGYVPRAGLHRVKGLISHGMAQTKVKFEFKLGEQRYRISRRVPLNGAQSATLERLEGEDWLNEVDGGGVTAVNKRVIELLKLEFDAFTRAVVLPQGKFAEFLAGDGSKRREVLTELLGLGHYLAMGQIARGRARDLDTKAETRKQLLEENYADVSAEVVTDLETVASEAQERAGLLADKVQAAVELERQRRQLAGAEETLNEIVGELTGLQAELAEVIDSAGETEDRELALANEAKEAADLVTAHTKTLAQAKKKLTTALDRNGDLEHLARVEAAIDSVERCERQLADQTGLLTKATEEASKLDEAIAKKGPAAEKAAEALSTATEACRGAKEDQRTAEQRAAELARQLDRHDEALQNSKAAETEAEKAKKRLARAAATLEPATTRLTQAEAKLAQLQHENAAALLASEVGPGDPCPVCQRPLDEHPSHDGAASEELAAAQQKTAELRQSHSQALAEQRAAQEGVDSCDKQAKAANKALKASLGDSVDRDVLAEKVNGAEESAEAAMQAVVMAEELVESERNAESTLRGELSELHVKLKGVQERRAELQERIDELGGERDQCASLVGEHFGARLPKEPLARLEKQRAEVGDARKAVEDQDAELDAASDAQASIAERLQGVKDELAALDTQLAALRARADGARADLAQLAARVEVVDGPQDLPAELEGRAPRAMDLRRWCDAAEGLGQGALEQLNEGIANADQELLALAREVDVEAPAGSEVCEQLRAAEAEARDERTRSKSAVETMKKRFKESEKMRGEIAKHTDEAGVLKALAAELSGNRFVEYVQQRTLDVLAARASDELQKISDERYSLVSEDGDFYVVDHANADERRGVETLSGGETFLASLSLALALSQYVGELATEGMGAKLEAVFIDEGFGALDDEALNEVIDALQRLREGELMVGVITHVRALAQRIRDGVRVESDGGKASVQLVAVD